MEKKTYKITITERLVRTVVVKAEDEDQARDCVENHYYTKGDIILDAGDYDETVISNAKEAPDYEDAADFDATEEV